MPHPFFSLLFNIVLLINLLFIITAMYIERKKPYEALVWILILLFLPIVGFVLYLFLGRSVRVKKQRLFRDKQDYDEQYNAQLVHQEYLSHHQTINYTADNAVTLFTEAKDKYHRLMDDIEQASDSIHLLYFIIKNDQIGGEIVRLLAKKARQGVEVRLLYDHLGSFTTPFGMFKELIAAGGHVHRFFPLRWGTYLRLNYRNHRKIAVIDGQVGYLGGMNIGDEYLGKHKRIRPWRDTHLRLTGSSVHYLQRRFLVDWHYASDEEGLDHETSLLRFFPPPDTVGITGIQIISSGPDTTAQEIKQGIVKLIYTANTSVYIQTPYFIPDDTMLEALQMAAASGVTVRVMLPAIPDKITVYRASVSYIQDLLDYGVEVYLYQGFLHAKMVVIDEDAVSIGTANMDIRSFRLDFEINAFIDDPAFARRCAAVFHQDMESCQLVTASWYQARSRWLKTQEGFFRLFSPLM